MDPVNRNREGGFAPGSAMIIVAIVAALIPLDFIIS